VNICHSSDWHADAVTLGVRRLAEIEKAAWETAKAAKKAGCSHYLFTGDLCDPDKNMNVYDAVRVAQDIALWLTSQNIESHWVAGNHDVVEDGSGTTTLRPLKALGGLVRVYEQPDVVGLGEDVSMIVLPFTATSHSYDPAKFVEKAEMGNDTLLVAGHLNIEGVIPGEETREMPRGRDVYYPVKALRKLKNPKLLVNGHYHRRMVTDDGIHVPGTLARLTFGEEENQPGYFIYTIQGVSFEAKVCLVTAALEMRTVDMTSIKRDGMPKGERFIRLKPGEKTTDADIEKAKSFWSGNGAKGIKVLPRPRSKVVINDEKRPAAKKTTVRETALAMVEEANSVDKARLRQVVEETLARVGE
jgi:DNA repair exonuclease SbcCD nuclease subunit